ncbi:hypothetical protein LTR56_023923 [Elasticomyces elasticus]|nr:hypothetical protein LTR22_028012 [Elasticomyces elasticus]KAK3619591.1 hypothetical protein LTR56_023923 [Elasticomyces elasticus]KAK4906464.1 hypothetical protein LTR49_024391 [Elasticomyces elasticus]KAK5745079.1 hypothetical protein LTS12_023233 [Elasticomyces elasticus]
MDIATYRGELAVAGEEAQRRSRSQWLTTNTLWATIWALSKTLGKPRARDKLKADVLYCTAADFILHVRAGKLFSKLLVIKEIFANSGMHSRAVLDVAPGVVLTSLGRCSQAAVHHAAETSTAEELDRRLQGNVGTNKEPIALYAIWHIDFNNLTFSGAVSGSQLNVVCGMWPRNLEGMKYWMMVSEAAMASEWKAFMNDGDDWLPGGRERLVVLEEDDILLIPPGVRLVHATLSSVSCLTEGGMVWDELSTLETLCSIAWTRESGVMSNEDIAHLLPCMIPNLKRQIHARTDKIWGTQGSIQFLDASQSVT